MNEAPTDRDAILLDPSMFCEEHMGEVSDWNVPPFNAYMMTQYALLASEEFFELAYRVKNGYAPPDGVGWGEEESVPDGEKPGVQHMNDVIREIEPLCCWVVENLENPWPDEDAPAYIAILSDASKRAKEENNDAE